MAIREIPDPSDSLVDAFLIEGVTLDGGAQNTTGLAQFDDLFVTGSIFDGGRP